MLSHASNTKCFFFFLSCCSFQLLAPFKRDQNTKLFCFLFVAPQVAAAPEVPLVQAQTAPVVKAIPVQPQVYAATAPTVAIVQDHPVTVVQAHAAPVQPQVYAPNAVPISLTNTQHHAQTESGAYSYGYSNALSSKQESKSEDGTTQGTYSYVDANGLVQTVNYVSDVLGFRVSATNLPVAPGVEDGPGLQKPKSSPTSSEKPAIDVDIRGAALFETPASEKKVVAEFFKTTEPIVEPAPIVQAIPEVKSVPVQPQAYEAAIPAVPIAQDRPAPIAQAQVAQVQPPQVYAAAVPVSPVVQYHPVPVVQASAVPVQPQVYAPNALPISLTNTQYHAQTESGAYSYGYGNALSSKQESKSEDGITHGTYSYVDANGLVQTVNYVSDALGFRVSATNLPVAPGVEDGPVGLFPGEVKSDPLPSKKPEVAPDINIRRETLVETAKPVIKPVQTPNPTHPQIVYAHSVYAPNAQPIDLANTQYHSQDDFGGYNYGYSNPLSSKQEFKSPDGITQGSYSYVDAYGLLQTVNYVSDALGFRVAATNLPVAPVATVDENSYSTPAFQAVASAPYDDAVYAVPVISQEKEEAPPATMVDVRIGKEIAEQSITQAHYHTQDEHGREDPTLLKKFFFIILDCTIPLQDNTNLDMRTSIPTEQRAKTLMVLWWDPTITLMKLVCPKLSNMLPTKKDFKLPAPPFPYTIWNIRFRSKIRPKLSQLVKLI